MLSHPFWMRMFAGDATIVGKPITLNGLGAGTGEGKNQYTVVGVLPHDFLMKTVSRRARLSASARSATSRPVTSANQRRARSADCVAEWPVPSVGRRLSNAMRYAVRA